MKIFNYLLIGSLSMLFAEVLAGSSQMWFFDGWSLLVTFPLYLFHVIFFLWLAFKLKKTSIYQLYFFGMMFSLYEAWITKVLWAGYGNNGFILGSIAGVGVSESAILILFWHPLISFILPILVYEILTGKVIVEHTQILTKSLKKTLIITLFLILLTSFIINGNQFNAIFANIALIGSILIVFVLYLLAKKSDIKSFEFGILGFLIVTVYLVLLYLISFHSIEPQKNPSNPTSYLIIVIFYLIALFFVLISGKSKNEVIERNKSMYSKFDLIIFAVISIVALNVAFVFAGISPIILSITYYLLTVIGIIVFFAMCRKALKRNKNQS